MNLVLQKRKKTGYTLIESLVGSAVLMIGISAAASLSLSLLTQEEINERTVRALNYLDTAATLVHLGVSPDEVESYLPLEPVVSSINFTGATVVPSTAPAGSNVSLSSCDITMVYRPSAATAANSSTIKEWTGGEQNITRSHTVKVLLPEQSF